MLHIVNMEEIQNLLLRVPEIVEYYERRDIRFAEKTKDWLVQVERVLADNKLAVLANVASLRGILISAERGSLPAGVEIAGQKTVRKIKSAVAADVIQKASSLVSDAIAGTSAATAEGDRLARQLFALAKRKNIIPLNAGCALHVDWLKAVLKAISDDTELGPGAAHLTGLVGFYDALILLDRASAAVAAT
ncbi:MAG: hypothetical protein M1469_03520 [Bacteroidetes bacterium]|nr:hypothetical protein [Bacteroidota bacterium]